MYNSQSIVRIKIMSLADVIVGLSRECQYNKCSSDSCIHMFTINDLFIVFFKHPRYNSFSTGLKSHAFAICGLSRLPFYEFLITLSSKHPGQEAFHPRKFYATCVEAQKTCTKKPYHAATYLMKNSVKL